MEKKKRELLHNLGDVALHHIHQTSEYFLYDNINQKYFGNNGGDSYDYFYINDNIIYLITKDKKCTIYSMTDKRFIVYCWPFLLKDLATTGGPEFLLKNPETGKFHVFIKELYSKNNGLFETEFDDATVLTGKLEEYPEFNIRLKQGDVWEYCNSYGLIKELSGDNIEVILDENIIDKKDDKERFILRCGSPYDQYTSPFYRHVCVSHIINNELHCGETYLISCMDDNETAIYECYRDGIFSTTLTTFKTQQFDSVIYITTMPVKQGNKNEPNEYRYFFLGRRDGKKYLLYADKYTEYYGTVEQAEPINLSEPIEITKITPCGKDARVLHTIDGKQALIQCHEIGQKKRISMTSPEYIEVTRPGEEMFFILNKGITPENKGMSYDIFCNYYEQKACSILQVSENFVLSFKDFKLNVYKKGDMGLQRCSLPFDRLIPYGENCYLGYNNDKPYLVALNYEDLYIVGEIDGPKGEEPTYAHLIKVNGKYHCVLGDYKQVIDDNKPYLNYPMLYNCYGGLINAIDENNKSTLFTWQGEIVMTYDQEVKVTIEERRGECLWAVDGGSFKDYYRSNDDGSIVRTTPNAFKKIKS